MIPYGKRRQNVMKASAHVKWVSQWLDELGGD